MRLHDVDDGIVSVSRSPIALPLEHHGKRGDRLGTSLHHTLHRVVMRECADIAAAVLDDIDFEPSWIAWIVGSTTHVSVQRRLRTIFLRPVLLIAATKFASSQEFIDERSIGDWPKDRLDLRPHIAAEALVSTVDRTTGTSNVFAALLEYEIVVDDRLGVEVATPNSICGCRSMIATTQLSGVNSPFSLSFTRLLE